MTPGPGSTPWFRLSSAPDVSIALLGSWPCHRVLPLPEDMAPVCSQGAFPAHRRLKAQRRVFFFFFELSLFLLIQVDTAFEALQSLRRPFHFVCQGESPSHCPESFRHLNQGFYSRPLDLHCISRLFLTLNTILSPLHFLEILLQTVTSFFNSFLQGAK